MNIYNAFVISCLISLVMYEVVTFTKDVTLLPEYYDNHIDDHLLRILKQDFEHKIFDGHLIIEVLGLQTKDIYRHHYIMDGIAHLTATFQCATEILYVGEMVNMVKIDENAVGSFWRTDQGYLKCFTLGQDAVALGSTSKIRIDAKSRNSFTLGTRVAT